jgi:site-specific recombinase XerD
MATRIQVILEETEREAFRSVAEQEGMSLSAWLRQAGKDRLAAKTQQKTIRTAKDLLRFFKACDTRSSGKEPDWEEHKKVIARSQASGATDT